MHFKKTKANKLKIGDTVRINQSMVDWYCTHLAENYGIMDAHCSFKEIEMSSMPDIAFWSLAKVAGVLPKGKVMGYGSTDQDLKTGKELKRNCVRVVSRLPARIEKAAGKRLEYAAYYSESNLNKVNR